MKKHRLPYFVAAAVIALMAWQGFVPDPVLCEARAPELAALDGFSFAPGEISEAELTTLPADTIIRRGTFAAEDGTAYHVSVVIGGRSKSSIHRPEMCLPSQGYQMRAPHTLAVGGRDWRRLDLARDNRCEAFAYTFFDQTGFATASHLARIFKDVWDRSILNRIDRWVMVSVAANHADEAAFKEFLARLEELLK